MHSNFKVLVLGNLMDTTKLFIIISSVDCNSGEYKINVIGIRLIIIYT